MAEPRVILWNPLVIKMKSRAYGLCGFYTSCKILYIISVPRPDGAGRFLLLFAILSSRPLNKNNTYL